MEVKLRWSLSPWFAKASESDSMLGYVGEQY